MYKRRRFCVVLVTSLLLSACASPSGDAVTVVDQYRDLPSPQDVVTADRFRGAEHDDLPYNDLELSWLGDGTLAVTTWWSGSCPKVPTRMMESEDEFVIVVEGTPAGACTDDLAPTTTVIEPPDGWAADTPVTARRDDETWLLTQRRT